MFLDGRVEQSATIQSKENAIYIERQDFRPKTIGSNSVYILKRENVKPFNNSQIRYTDLSEKDFDNIKNSLNEIKLQMLIMKDKLECAGVNNTSIEHIVEDIGYLAEDIEDSALN